MRRLYDVLVTIHYPENFKGKKYLKVGYIIKADDEDAARVAALARAQLSQIEHPRKYKGCTFSIVPEDCKIFNV